ncbi:hypothetical protein L3X39_07775 [Sabulilitoribacter multivorans]|uniref:Uncharacterized protein n=1 Tax=Flaviramulus multivorans TaxID=1304750 RepID=A0ABS9IIE5_9FLAO|nr:hypothetical protein [Flaviramulus multivorans]MCF7560533.1 hypothetical protein [Flaviramulus multivorans]
MKKLLLLVFLTCISLSCKQNSESKTDELEIVKKELTVAEKIAQAHGFENWKNVSEINFNFRGNRHWKWQPKTNNITLMTKTDTINYNRKQIDSLSIKVDQAFINDKFWLLIPFQLVWDKSAFISEPVTEVAPISKSELNKITITYTNEGGYTPGDAYDIFYDTNYIIKEWVFRRGNQEEPSLTNTFENYQDFNGIKIALDHKNNEGTWNLEFTDVSVTLE